MSTNDTEMSVYVDSAKLSKAVLHRPGLHVKLQIMSITMGYFTVNFFSHFQDLFCAFMSCKPSLSMSCGFVKRSNKSAPDFQEVYQEGAVEQTDCEIPCEKMGS